MTDSEVHSIYANLRASCAKGDTYVRSGHSVLPFLYSPLLVEGEKGKVYIYDTFKEWSSIVSRDVLILAVAKASVGEAVHYANAIAKPPPKQVLEGLGLRLFKEFTVIETKTTLQRVAISLFRPRICSKLMKDITVYATLKVDNEGATPGALGKVFENALYANILTHLAIFIVEQVWDTWNYYSKKIRDEEKYWAKTKKNVILMSGSIVLGAVGATVGTIFKPGLGTRIGNVVGESVLFAVL